MANNPDIKVKIVPVGLSYFHAHRFRSRAVIEFGPALGVPEEFVEKFKRGGLEKREAVSEFLDLVYEALKTVTIRAPDYDTLMVGGTRDITWIFLTRHLAYSSGQTIVPASGAALDFEPGGRTEQTFFARL
jgi:hypothetical protein